ncbi:hypothetical protein DWV84_24165 [Blautia sp. AF13-16]|uniref:Thoeris anti-defense Tad2 family protein n=1 Tax=Blautia sp. AF13-16 TaxID=2292195 RepID=UPI000E53D75A|nr:hypothetical protein [Blautia sp. AF13-16]RHS11239.1 hypothetical protein DWV84_24165 [Blautia sp. AF13-16]
MNIYNAVKQALQEKKVMYRREVAELLGCNIAVVIKPTNSYGCCVIETVRRMEGKWVVEKAGTLWNPTADDLQAEDWTSLE